MKLKLKPVVASLVVLGLMAPAFAHKASGIVAQQAVIDSNSVISTVATDGWFNRVSVGGKASVVGIGGSHDLPGSFAKTSSGSDVYVNNANLLVNAELSQSSKATLNLAYLGAPDWRYSFGSGALTTDGPVTYSVNHNVFVDEAYVTLANLAKYPFYAKIGKMYVPFGEYRDQYVPWQIESPAQMLAQTNAPAVVVGASSDFGFYADIFALKGDSSSFTHKSNSVKNFGAKIGYHDDLSGFNSPNTHINMNLSYIRSIWDSLFFTPNTSSPRSLFSSPSMAERDPVGGIGAHIDLAYRDFTMYADFVATLSDMHKGYSADSYSKNSKFWGANVNAAYAFETLSHDSSLGAGVQFSGNGQWFADSNVHVNSTTGLYSVVIPKWRVLAEYKVNLFKNTDLGLVYAHSKSYDLPISPVEARSTNVGIVRLAVRF